MRKRLLLGVCGVLLVVAGCGGGTAAIGHGILFVHSGAGKYSPFSPVDLWTSGTSAVRIGPADASVTGEVEWSPDGKSIAFSGQISKEGWDEANPTDVYVMGVNGQGVKQLTHSTGPVDPFLAPTWSPDGSEIVVAGYDSELRPVLEILSVQSGAVRPLHLLGSPLAWGKQGIFYAPFAGRARIVLFDLATGVSKIVVSGPAGHSAFSKTGRLAALEGDGLVVYSSRGRVLERRLLKAPVRSICGLTWSPDGKRLLVVRERYDAVHDARYDLWTTRLPDGRWRKLPLRSVEGCAVSWR